jgi:hypothetical protein
MVGLQQRVRCVVEQGAVLVLVVGVSSNMRRAPGRDPWAAVVVLAADVKDTVVGYSQEEWKMLGAGVAAAPVPMGRVQARIGV